MKYNGSRRLAAAALIIAACGTVSADRSEDGAALHFFNFGSGYLSSMSDNGKWATFKRPDFDEEDAVARRLDLTYGTIQELPLMASQREEGHICICRDITDDGEMIFGSFDGLPAYYKEGEWHDLELPFRSRGYQGDAYSVSPDGRWAAGWVMQSFTYFRPVLWHDLQPVVPSTLPSYQELYDRGVIDAATLQEHLDNAQTPNIAFRKISADGKCVLASTDHNYPAWGCAFFVYHPLEDTYEWIADPQAPRGTYVSDAQMSDNGEWVIATYTGSRTSPDGSWDDYHVSFRYHVPTGEVSRPDGHGLICNDGLSRSTAVYAGGQRISCETILRQLHGLDAGTVSGNEFDRVGSPWYISSDTRTLLCAPTPREYAFALSVPGTWEEEAARVNPLGECTAVPETESVISGLDNVVVEFDTAVSPDPRIKAVIEGPDGCTVSSSSCTPLSSRRVRIEFPHTAFAEGREYTVSLPEGMFTDATGSHISPAIRLHYTGRAASALYPIAISPAPDNSIMELSLYNMVVMEFDTQPLVTPGAKAELFETGSDKPLASLRFAQGGNRIGLYPEASRKLAKGKSYRISVYPNSLTEPTGSCPNDTVSFVYHGSFVAETPSTDGNVLFFDDFYNPNESLNHFLQYDGDRLTPVAEMRQWGFDADNTPWNFSIRDDSDYDYCAASTSMYEEAGPADDWLVLPRLTVANESTRLSFKAQSYLLNGGDRLLVFVWECDDVLGSLDYNTMRRLRQEAVKVADVALTPGMLENQLAGDWQYFDISLADFKDKNVYIAFANLNERGSTLFVDDILVSCHGRYTLSSGLPRSVAGRDCLEVSALVTATAPLEAATWRASCRCGDWESQVESSGPVSLAEGESMAIVFPECCPLLSGEENEIAIDVSLGGESQSLAVKVDAPAFEVERSVLLEEGTGAWCGYCPLGFLAMDFLQARYPGRVVEVSVHHNDIFAMEDYIGFLGFYGFPCGRVDRDPYILAPAVTDATTGLITFSSENGNETFFDIISRQLDLPAKAAVTLEDLTVATEGVQATLRITAAMNIDGNRINILPIVTEYGQAYMQENNLSGSTDPLAGEWGAGDRKMRYEYPAVARGIGSTGYHGIPGLLPARLYAGETYCVDLSFPLPGSVVDPGKCRLAVALLDNETGKVMNTAHCGYGLDSSGIAGDIGRPVWSVEGGRVCYLGKTAGVRLFDMQGLPVSSDMPHGYVIAVAPDGTSARLLIPGTRQ